MYSFNDYVHLTEEMSSIQVIFGFCKNNAATDFSTVIGITEKLMKTVCRYSVY